MSVNNGDSVKMTSSRPYFLRAVYEWIVDNQLTPHILVDAENPGVAVPKQHIKDGKIVLNVAPEAISELLVTNSWVKFQTRFSGVVYDIRLPVMTVKAIYAAENGQGMFFEDEPDSLPPPPDLDDKSDKKSGRPSLKIVK